MKCNGKCHMMKEMKEQENNEQNPAAPTPAKQETVQFFQKNSEFTFRIFTPLNKYNSFFLLPELPSVSFSVFHPPTV